MLPLSKRGHMRFQSYAAAVSRFQRLYCFALDSEQKPLKRLEPSPD
jgi:hypothetical protein